MDARETFAQDQIAGAAQAAQALITRGSVRTLPDMHPVTKVIRQRCADAVLEPTLEICAHIDDDSPPVTFWLAIRPTRLNCEQCAQATIAAYSDPNALAFCAACAKPYRRGEVIVDRLGPVLLLAKVCSGCLGEGE